MRALSNNFTFTWGKKYLAAPSANSDRHTKISSHTFKRFWSKVSLLLNNNYSRPSLQQNSYSNIKYTQKINIFTEYVFFWKVVAEKSQILFYFLFSLFFPIELSSGGLIATKLHEKNKEKTKNNTSDFSLINFQKIHIKTKVHQNPQYFI